jgi:2-oxoglutarate dehydrogenase E1 component
VIDEVDQINKADVTRLVFVVVRFITICLKNVVSWLGNVAIVRIEQLYPYPEQRIAEVLLNIQTQRIVWCQEEPKNQGAWLFIAPFI